MGANQREADHLKQHLESGFDAIWVAAPNQEILGGLKQRVKDEGLDRDRVAFQLVREFGDSEINEK